MLIISSRSQVKTKEELEAAKAARSEARAKRRAMRKLESVVEESTATDTSISSVSHRIATTDQNAVPIIDDTSNTDATEADDYTITSRGYTGGYDDKRDDTSPTKVENSFYDEIGEEDEMNIAENSTEEQDEKDNADERKMQDYGEDVSVELKPGASPDDASTESCASNSRPSTVDISTEHDMVTSDTVDDIDLNDDQNSEEEESTDLRAEDLTSNVIPRVASSLNKDVHAADIDAMLIDKASEVAPLQSWSRPSSRSQIETEQRFANLRPRKRFPSFSESISDRLELLQNIDEKERQALNLILPIGVVEQDYIHGSCRDMCPETERYFREVRIICCGGM